MEWTLFLLPQIEPEWVISDWRGQFWIFPISPPIGGLPHGTPIAFNAKLDLIFPFQTYIPCQRKTYALNIILIGFLN